MQDFATAMSRLGTESAFEVLARAEALRAQGNPVLNLGIGQPDFPTAPHIVEAAVKALRDGHHGYTPAQGLPELREAVSDYANLYLGAALDPARILIVPGGKVTMAFAILMLGEPDVEILYPDPGFPIYASLIAYSGARGLAYGLPQASGFSFEAEEIAAQLSDKTRLLILNSPGNPTGGVADVEEMDKLARILEDFPQVRILSDEIYSRLLYEGRAHRSWASYPALRNRLILLDGWSKTYAMTGWRLGWSYWPAELIEPATRLAINIHSCVNASAQHAGLAALTGPQDAVDTMRATFAKRRDLLVEGLNAIPDLHCRVPDGAFYAFPDFSGLGLSGTEAQEALLNQAYVALVAGSAFGARAKSHVRFSYAASEEVLEEALQRLSIWRANL